MRTPSDREACTDWEGTRPGEGGAAVSCSVRAARKDLIEALKPLRRIVRKKDWDSPAVVSMEGQALKVAFVGGAVSIPAEGSWAGEVRVPTLLFVRLAVNLPKGIPAGDPLPIEVREDRLYVGTAWGRCVWQAAFGSEIPLPLDPDFMTLLKLPSRYSEDRLERAGLLPRVREAQERSRRLVRKAADVLSPLGVTESDLQRLVQERLGAGRET